MSEQDNSIRIGDDVEASGLLRSVEPAGGATYQMAVSDTVDGGADTGSDSDSTDGNEDTGGSGDADSSDDGGDSDGSDSDSDGSDS
jgi:hypothetical protein